MTTTRRAEPSASPATRSDRVAAHALFAADVIVVLLFVLIGRSAHHHALSWRGMASTTWPFGVGVLVGWAWVLARGPRGASLSSGIVVWLTTVGAGMVLRVVSGQGTAVAFIAVALGFLGTLMLSLRLLAKLLVARWARATQKNTAQRS
ncbi:MAG: DUF3054 domain-containing protein [Acidimicrobiales bacterium]